MYIEEQSTDKKILVDIELVTSEDFNVIKDLGKFDFDWNHYKNDLVFKLVPCMTNDMAGLMALIDYPEEGFCYIEIKLLESARENIAGTLIAFACREAFKKGYYGAVFLIPKTKLIPYYIQKYGFKNVGRGLWLDMDTSLELIEKYL